jgi:hypothetical protein
VSIRGTLAEPRRSTDWCTIAALAAALLGISSSALQAQEFQFVGPAPTRNFQPIQLIFLNLPFESAATIAPGELSLLTQTVEISEIATTQGTIESTLKFESNRTNFGLRYSPYENWEAGIDLPFISRYGGFLDPAIDWVESVFGLVNPERKLFGRNTFGGFSVVRGNTVLFDAGEENFQPGDLVFSAKHAFELPPEWPRLALRAAIKAPTGDAGAVLGSGQPDFGAGVAADYSPWERLMFYFNFDVVYPVGPITPGNLTLDPFIDESFAVHFALAPQWSVMIHQATYTSPFHTGTRLLDGTATELGFGMSFAYWPWFGAQVLGIENVSGVEQAADFSMMLSIVWRPWAHPTTLPPIGPVPPQPLPPLGEPLPHGAAAPPAASAAPASDATATPIASP